MTTKRFKTVAIYTQSRSPGLRSREQIHRQDLNLRPDAYKATALPTELLWKVILFVERFHRRWFPFALQSFLRL